MTETISFPADGDYLVSMRKMSSAAPFSMGIGESLLANSMFYFMGLSYVGADVSVVPVTSMNYTRHIQFYGASDTAGYCVDGTPDVDEFDRIVGGWRYENCDSANPSLLGKTLRAFISVQAIAGIGVIQNAMEFKQAVGYLTMPQLHNRTIQTDASPTWPFGDHPASDLVIISLGGNDYNHHGGNVPSNDTFNASYEAFLLQVFADAQQGPSMTTSRESAQARPLPQVVSICGQGDPKEKDFDVDNNRCRPCPHVEAAVEAFRHKHVQFASYCHYIFIPCDGTVVTGEDDIGCDGHKNGAGQAAVSRFLLPRIQDIMGWDEAGPDL
mmetsp:Transcript_7443/g.27325  ORF Transcript_7443/g.27325 Transcript_7443/m.27325 type:complete len:326 (-) Transcript_7443:2396-3373(-)